MNIDYIISKNSKFFEQVTLAAIIKSNKRIILTIISLMLAGFIYQYYTQSCQISATSTCIPTTGCTSNSCVNHKKFVFDSSGLKQCCKC
jgi:hypothetical protein